jgi:UPF0755 protein
VNLKTRFKILALLLLLIPVAVLWYWLFFPGNGEGQVVELEIYPGSSIQVIAELLVDEQLLRCPLSLRIASRLRGADRDFQAGLYLVSDRLSAWELVDIFRRGSRQFSQVTLPEGLSGSAIAGILARELEIDSSRLVELISDSVFARELQLSSDNLEGYLFPETYRFFRRQNPRSVLETLVRHHQQIWQSLTPGIVSQSFSQHELLTLASIIQGEMIDTSEAERISSVYHNRLRDNWRLQADPTVQYLLPEGPRRLLLDDLKIDSPYNTYLYRGLPPGPVNNPGEKALQAAVAPETTEYFFFVADGTGGHIFSRTAAEHARARQTLDNLRRELRRRR